MNARVEAAAKAILSEFNNRDAASFPWEAAKAALTAADSVSPDSEAMREFVNWVDAWVSNPVGSYSVSALDGLFAMTRDRIAALAAQDQPATPGPTEIEFDLKETLRAVLHFYGPEGAEKVTRHVLMARKSRDTNAEIDELEKIFGGLDATDNAASHGTAKRQTETDQRDE